MAQNEAKKGGIDAHGRSRLQRTEGDCVCSVSDNVDSDCGCGGGNEKDVWLDG